MTGPAGPLALDVNETLLDLTAMRPAVAAATGDAGLVGPWFARLLRDAMVAALTGAFRPFEDLARAALVAVAAARGTPVGPAAADAVVAALQTLPPHPDVPPALRRLRAAGIVCAALSNSSTALLAAQLRSAGLDGLVGPAISVEEAGTYKPDPRVYRHAAARLGVPVAGLTLVAAHDWDVTGAIRAGARGVFVARPGAVLGACGATPHDVVPDLGALADRLIGPTAGAG